MQYPYAAREDLAQQRFAAACERRRRQDEWLQKHQDATRLGRDSNKARLLILVDEAYRLERTHLSHQLSHCKNNLGAPWSPSKAAKIIPVVDYESVNEIPTASAAVDCPCVRAFTVTQLQPKFRALHILLKQFPGRSVEASFEAVRNSYRSDDDMLVDLIERYGPENPAEAVNPRVWLANIEDRIATLHVRWRSIRRKVGTEMTTRDNSAAVIRSLSVMRIFVEGSQSDAYGVDVVDRSRRDSIHQALLDDLVGRNALFV